MRDIPELLILRHGETEWNRIGRMQGTLDSPLTDAGLAQAQAQRALMASLGAGQLAWYASPLGRTMHTARIARPEPGPIMPDPRLQEIDMGAWNGLLRSEIAARAPRFFAPDADPLAWYGHAPGGETLEALAQRVSAFVRTLTQPSVIVTHGITSRMLRCLVLGLPVASFSRLGGGQGVAYRLAPGVYQRLSESGVEDQPIPDPSRQN